MMTRRNLVWLIPLFLFFTFPLWRIPVASFLSPRGGYDPSLAERKLDVHNFNMETVHITQSELGNITLEIIAVRAYTGTSENEFEMEEVDAVVTSAKGEQTFITARKGILDRQSAILTLIDEVVVMKPKDKFELYTDLLIYNDKSHIAQSPGKTLVIGEKIEIRGNNLIFNTLTESYDLGGRVRCKLTNFSSPDNSTSP
jgi:LPS export ABC transporter protein LptC